MSQLQNGTFGEFHWSLGSQPGRVVALVLWLVSCASARCGVSRGFVWLSFDASMVCSFATMGKHPSFGRHETFQFSYGGFLKWYPQIIQLTLGFSIVNLPASSLLLAPFIVGWHVCCTIYTCRSHAAGYFWPVSWCGVDTYLGAVVSSVSLCMAQLLLLLYI
jgi:hypothetical protein